jgi:DNA-directed RNA polymerase subunit L
VKRPCTEHSNETTAQQIAGSPDRGHSKTTESQLPEASLTRQNGVNTSSPTLTVDNVIHLHPCQRGTQSELTEAVQMEEEPVNGLPLPCSITDVVPSKAIPSGPTPVQQSEQPASHFQEVDPLGVNGIENEIADLAQRFCDDISVVRKRRKMVQFQQSESTVTFSSLLSNLLDLKHKVEQREEEGNQAQNALKQLQQQTENKVKEAVKKAVSEFSEENDRLRSEIRAISRNTVELRRRHDELEKENTSLRGILKGISTAAKPFDST